MRIPQLTAVAILLVSCSSVAVAQPGTGPAAGPGAGADPLTAAFRRQFDAVSRNIREAAEQVPQDRYSFQATKEVRTFAQLFGHIADDNYLFCSIGKGEPNPNTQELEKVTDKAALLQALSGAFAYCAAAWATASDRWLAEPLERRGQGPIQPRAHWMTFNTSHSNEHYGNVVTYMRLNGMVPPSTARNLQPPPTR